MLLLRDALNGEGSNVEDILGNVVIVAAVDEALDLLLYGPAVMGSVANGVI
ncbi:hypothetical protein VQH23_13710 [Pararoseomonas sp. SCSIO 73927]|uniref:hypothetical protein n=1 Tax=Pararoseomonas sp. SCSIO 73927 TaxID=3114537 RepID=UPI0030CD2E0B